MKRVRLEKWPGQVGSSQRPGAAAASSRPIHMSASCPRHTGSERHSQLATPPTRRYQSTDTLLRVVRSGPLPTPPSSSTTLFNWPSVNPKQHQHSTDHPSPLPSKALRSPKLAALHSRLALTHKVPLQTLARTLVDPTADEAPLFNNENLAFLGQTLIAYYTSEMLMCKYPRLPMEIMHAAMKAFAGDRTLFYVSRSWGVENAAAPGADVDPGLLQFDLSKPRGNSTKWGFQRPKAQDRPARFRRGISSRVLSGDDFGDEPVRSSQSIDSLEELDAAQQEQEQRMGLPVEKQLSLGDPNAKVAKSHSIHSQFVRAVVGAVYTHCGREAARRFIRAHVLSRELDLARLFLFKLPTRELARLCAREDFDAPVARLLSETGRLSRTPVFVVGVFSGHDKLGEGAAASLDHARQKASINALKAWYLYSPGEDVRVPSEMLEEGAKPWEPVYVDIGEVITPGVS